VRKDKGVWKAAGGLAVVVAVAPLLAMVPASAATSAQAPTYGNRLAEVAAQPILPEHTRTVGNVPSSMEISGAVGLRSRNQDGLNQFLAEVTNRYSPAFHHYLSRGEFARRFGASVSAVTQLARLLRSYDLHPSVSANRILMSFHGSAANAERAFATKLAEYRFSNGHLGWGTTSEARLPAGIAATVSGVVGLDNLVHDSTSLARAPRVARAAVKHGTLPKPASGGPSACHAAQAQAPFGGVTDDQVAHAYGVDGLYDAGDLGRGETVDIFELEPFALTDLTAFDECYFGSGETNSNNVSVTAIDGGAGIGVGSGEAALDVEDVSAIAPDAKIDVYEGPNTTYGSLDTYNTIATDDNASVVSTSWGLCEAAMQQGAPGTQEVESEIFAETAAQGQSVFAAGGDDGSDDCAESGSTQVVPYLSVDDPESQPYVTSVGGTTFTSITEPPGEAVWNDGSEWGGGGGGISDTWAEPSWQADSTVTGIADAAGTGQQPCSDDPEGTATEFNLAGFPTTLSSGTPCRLVPDVTALADEFTGITTFYSGSWSTVGGTSSSTPLWAAMTAEMNASSFCSGTTLGFVSPLLYDVASASPSDYADAFNDITVGNNDNLAVGNGSDWPATAGYDLASGLGSPKITNPNGQPGLAQQACDMVQGASTPPDVTLITPDSGPVAGATAVTITGSNFGATAGDVYVGTQAATVVSWSATSIAITTPAYDAPQGTGASAAGPAPVTVVTKSPERSSALDPATTVFHYLAGISGTAPVIDYVGPTAGGATGGYEVDLVGSGLSGATGVTFGGRAGTIDGSTNSNNGDTTLVVTVPAETGSTVCESAVRDASSVCQVQVQVTTPGGTSSEADILPAYQGPIEYALSGAIEIPADSGTEAVAAATEFDYAPATSVTNISPRYGSELGGSLEDITGSGFSILTYFWTDFGPATQEASQDFDVQSITPDNLFIVNTGDPTLRGPTTGPEAQAVTIVTSAGDDAVASGLFALAGVPRISSLSSHFGSTEGRKSLTLTGKGLSDVEAVQFAADQALLGVSETTVFTLQSATQLSLRTPSDLPLATEVLACTETGCSAVVPSVDDFVYGYPGAPIISKINPSAGPAAGGESLSKAVVITGTLLDSVVAVRFGKIAATVFENPPGLPGGGQDYRILALPPPGRAGSTVAVAVETAGGIATGHGFSNTVDYTYRKSAPSAPQDVTAKGGKRTITGAWTAPASDGGSAVTSYIVELVFKGDLKHVSQKVTVSASTRSHVFKGVAKGLDYTIAVIAKNRLGAGYVGSSAPTQAT